MNFKDKIIKIVVGIFVIFFGIMFYLSIKSAPSSLPSRPNYNYNNSINSNEPEQTNIETYFNNLKKLDFIELNDDQRCINNYTCFEKGNYFVSVLNTNNPQIGIDKIVSEEEVSDFNFKDDASLINEIYGSNIDDKLIDIVNELFSKMDKERYDSFTIESNYLHLYISHYKSSTKEEIRYSISKTKGEEHELFTPVEISTISHGNKEKKIADFYNLSMKNNSKYFKFNDYFDYIFDLYPSICSVNIQEGDYILKSDFCHGGTSDMYFEFDYQTYGIETSITTTYKKELFDELYLQIINNDLKYLNRHFDKGYKLSSNDEQMLANFINKRLDTNKTAIVIDDEIYITITSNNLSYTIKYKMFGK